jgi:hypothetical protein
MARPQVADEGEGFQIWRVVEDILNNKSRTADEGVFQFGIERGANNSSP